MLNHMVTPTELAAQARVMVDAGAQCVYVVDSADALITSEAAERVAALVQEIGMTAQVGYHGHMNLTLGVANSLLAYEAGARQIDGSTCGLGAGAGNSPAEILAAVFNRLGVQTGIDVTAILAAAEDVVRPYMVRQPITDRSAVTLGHAGVYSSFLLHAERAAARYGVAAHDILAEVGMRRYVGGQEDMITNVA